MRTADTEYGKAKTEAQLRAVAQKVVAMRNPNRKGGPVPYDGPNGLVAQGIVPTATVARALVARFGKVGKGDAKTLRIAPSYDRAAYGMQGKRVDPKTPATRKQAPKPKRTRKAKNA